MKDYLFIICLLFIFPLDVSSTLYLSQESVLKALGDHFVVICKDNGGQPVSWEGPRGALGLKTHPKMQTLSYGTVILFNDTLMEDEGTYTCKSPTESRQFHLKVAVPMTFMDTAPEQRGTEGEDVLLRCEVKGGQSTWVTDDIPKHKYRIVGDGMVIINVSRHDSGTYVCKAFQENTGIVYDRKIRLIVEHKPVFPYPVYAKQEQAWGYLTGTVNLTCHVEAEPPPKFDWKKRNDKHKGIQRIFSVSPHVSVLQIVVSKHSFGEYKCTASNPLGKLEKIFSLDQGTKPSPPTSVELKGANADILDLGIVGPEPTEQELEDHMEPQWYNVAYKKANVDEWWQQQEFNMTEENTYPLQGLDPNTDYEVRVASKNLAGLSDYTNITVYKTLPSSAAGVFLPLSTNTACYLSRGKSKGFSLIFITLSFYIILIC